MERVLDELGESYRRDYLEGTNHSDALQRAMARLLELLEVPAVAGTLGRLRTVVTWPARQIGKIIKTQRGEELPPSDLEQETLNQLIEHSLLKLRQGVAERGDNASQQSEQWWKALENQLVDHQANLTKLTHDAIEAHQVAFEPEVEAAAQSLYTHLQDHPTTLNGLRAARISTDAAAVVLAVKSAGLGVSDLVFAPAMLAFTSMLTEGAVGQYMNSIESDLRDTQLDSMRTRIREPLKESLLQIGSRVHADTLLGISRNELNEASDSLEKLA